MRHTAALWMVQQDVDLYAAGQIVGHKTRRMTQRHAALFKVAPAAFLGAPEALRQLNLAAIRLGL